MLCRSADEIFWMSRYVERAIAVGRLIEVTWHLELDAGDLVDSGARFWMPLLGLEGDGGHAHTEGQSTPGDVRRHLSLDRGNPSSLVSCIGQARASAQRVRESISTEMWEQINELYLSLAHSELGAEMERDPYLFFRRVREGAQFFQGLADGTMAHDEAWDFICLGTYLERADNVARLLDLQTHLLTAESDDGNDPSVRWLAVLRSCGAAEPYARYYSLRIDPARVIEFLLLNPVFPQSLRFSLVAARNALAGIEAGRHIRGERSAERLMGRVCGRLENAAVDEVLDEGLHTFLLDTRARIGQVADQVTRTYLRDEPDSGKLVGVARATMIMAAQQQQQTGRAGAYPPPPANHGAVAGRPAR
ncbi:MAG: hypothetical protein HW416_1063 [Chloroflexi bacterium]|nr:hypothetical protein [Chloroflexota bacterium]